jgi:hypothetical protein
MRRHRQRVRDERAAVPAAAPHQVSGVGEFSDRLAHGVTADGVQHGELAL